MHIILHKTNWTSNIAVVLCANMDFVPRKVRLGFDSTKSKANKHGQTEPQDARQQGQEVYLGEVREEGEERVSNHLLARDPLMAVVFLRRIYRKGVREDKP